MSRISPCVLLAVALLAIRASACEQEHKNTEANNTFLPTSPLSWEGPLSRPLSLNLSDGTECEIRLRISDPIEASIELKKVADFAAAETWKIEVHVDSSRGPTVEPASIANGRFRYRLQKGSYSIILKPPADARHNAKPGQVTHELLLRSFVKLLIPTLALSNSPLVLRLDRYTHLAECRLHLSHRSMLWMKLDVPQQWSANELQRLQLTALPNGQQTQEVYPTLVLNESQPIRFYFVLNPGEYRISLKRRVNSWPTPLLPETIANVDMFLRITDLKSAPLPIELRPLSLWIKSLGLEGKLDVVDIYKETSVDRGLSPEVERHYKELLETICRQDIALSELKNRNTLSLSKYSNRKCEVLVLLRTSRTRDEIRAIETQFQQQSHSSFWDRALRKVAMVENIPTYKIAMYLPVPCSGSLIFEDAPGTAERHGLECMMGTAKQQIQLPSLAVTEPGIASLANRLNMKEIIGPFLEQFLPKQANIDYLDRSEDSIEAIVRNIHGHVIVGGREWEKIDIAVILTNTSEAKVNLTVFVDGLTSSGIGSYPPDSQFTTSMEPAHSQDLTQYARRFAAAFGEYLEHNNQ